DSPSQAALLLHLATRATPHQPRARPRGTELRGHGRPRSDPKRKRSHHGSRIKLARRLVARSRARGAGGCPRAASTIGGHAMPRHPNSNGRSWREVASSTTAAKTDPLRRRRYRLAPLAFVLVFM